MQCQGSIRVVLSWLVLVQEHRGEVEQLIRQYLDLLAGD